MYRVLVGEPEGKNYFKNLHIDGRIILNASSRYRMTECGLDEYISGNENWWALVNMVMNFIFYILHSMQYDSMVTL